MPRPRLTRARLRARRAQRMIPVSGDLPSTWIEVGGAELRLRRDDGDFWSTPLPDPALALGRLEFGAHDLASLHEDDAPEDDPEEAQLGRS